MGGGRKRFFRIKVCYFCTNKSTVATYKDTDLLRKFVTERGKTPSPADHRHCAKHQRIGSPGYARHGPSPSCLSRT